MNADRWQDVARIYNGALDLDDRDRSKYIADATGGDEDLRREVESLFAQDREASVLDRPMAEAMSGLLPPEALLQAGARLGPYEINRVVGAGGMGHVYRATDTRLHRTVAIKVLRNALSSDAQFRERFDREAKVIASLTHPHICALYDVRRENDVDFLVLEYLEGETLAARLSRGALPLEHALRHGVEIAEALAAAHRSGIVHRDLKPGNVVVTKAGAKLLDFGLAKPIASPIRNNDASALPTLARDVTAEGTVLGTVQYMSPEQLEGRTADARTDIFAFGAVVYEMVTGRKAFEGGSPASVIGAILKDDPRPLDESQPLTPPLLEHIVRRCLAKDPDERWQSAADLARELRWLSHSSPVARALPAADARPRLFLRSSTFAWLTTAAVAVAALAIAWLWPQQQPAEQGVVTRFAVPLPDDTHLPALTTRAGNAVAVDPLAISRDGRKIAFVAESPDGVRRLWIRTLDSLETHDVAGAEGANSPFWSPDGRFVAFFADGTLKKVDLAGGAPVVVCDVPEGGGSSGSWGADDVIIFRHAVDGPPPGAVIYRVSAAGGTPAPATERGPGEITHSRPVFLPDGRHFLYYAFSPSEQNPDRPKHPVVIGSLDSPLHRKLLLPDAMNVGVSRGHVLFMRDTTLMAQPFDLRTLSFTGDAVPAARDVKTQPGNPTSALFAASDNGVLVYQSGVTASTSELVWFDRTGRPTGRIGEPANFQGVRLSPDGRQLAATVLNRSSTEGDIWFYDTAGNGRRRFTFDPVLERSLVWANDGREVLFNVRPPAIYRQSADGGPREQLKIDAARVGMEGLGLAVSDVSPDGRLMLFFAGGGLWTLPFFGDRQPSRWMGSPGTMHINGQFDPTGHWIAYQSNETGSLEVYVAAFPGPGVKRQISTAGGLLPRWRRDGNELVFLALDGTLMSAAIRSTTYTFDVTGVRPLFTTRRKLLANGVGYPYDVSADGARFLINTTPEETASTPLTVVLNWTEGL